MSLERYLEELRDGSQPVKHAGLVHLSGLEGPELEEFRRQWDALVTERRRQVVTKLVDLAEDNVDLDFNAVLRLCLRDPDPEVREQAVSGFWECDDRALILPLINMLRWDEAEQVRAAAAGALGKFAVLAEEGKALPRDSERIQEALLAVIDSPREPMGVRRRAIEAIAALRLPRVKEIIDEAYRDREPLLRRAAVYAMGKSCDPQWLPVILSELESQDTAMRYEAASACGELGEEVAIPSLALLLNDEDHQVRLATVSALGALGGRAAKRVLQGFLKEGDDALHDVVEEALQRIAREEDPLAFKFEP